LDDPSFVPRGLAVTNEHHRFRFDDGFNVVVVVVVVVVKRSNAGEERRSVDAFFPSI
jgi:hypothetical protein